MTSPLSPPPLPSPLPFSLSVRERSLGRRMFCRNAFLWGLGNGLVSTSLVIYVIIALASGSMSQAQIGLAIAWIIAAPRLIGVLRLFAPALIDAAGSHRRVALTGYLLSPIVLSIFPLSLPLLSRWGETRINAVLWTIGLLWAFYHLIEYFATVAIWSWMADFLSPKIRPLFLARRERFMIAGQLIGRLAAGLYVYGHYEKFRALDETWRAYLLPTGPGIVFLAVAAWPLIRIPETFSRRKDAEKAVSVFRRFGREIRNWSVPFRSKRFRLFLLFGCWIQIAGGLSQSAQSFFQMKILGVTMLTTLLLESGTRIGRPPCPGRSVA